MTWDNVQQLIRIVMHIVAGYLLNNGIVTEEVSTQLTAGVISLASVAWWFFWNKKRPESTA